MLDLVISIVSTPDLDMLGRCLEKLSSAIKGIKYKVFVVDNANGAANKHKDRYPDVDFIVNRSLLGFSENHNAVIAKSKSRYVLIMNPDVLIEKGFVEELLSTAESDKKIGVVTGKLLREDMRTIDSTGHIIFKNRRSVDRGQGEEDKGQYNNKEEVFSSCGAAIFCKREMLDDIKLFDEYLDNSFYIYKEDLDLCWRARLRGWKIVYAPKATAIHSRGWGSEHGRSKIPSWIRRHSYRNRYLMILKDDHLINILLALPYILLHELKALIYIIFREPHLVLSWFQLLLLLPLTLKKRASIMKRATVSAKEIRKWFV